MIHRHEHKEQNWLITISLVVLALVALAVALIYTRTVMIPFVVALFIVALVSPIEDFQVKRLRLPRVVAIVVTLLVVLSVIALASLFVAQAIRTIAYTAQEYSTSFANMADKLLMPLAYLYKLDEPAAPPTAPDAPKPKLPAAPNDVGPAQSKPEAMELFPVVNDADRPALLGVRPQPNPRALTPGLPKPMVPDLRPPLSPSAPTKDAAETTTLDVPAPRNALAQDSNQAVAAAGAPTEPAKSQWHDTMRELVKELIANARQIIRDLANHMFNMLRNTVGTIFGLLSGVLLVCVFVIFLLAGRNPYAEHSQMYNDVVAKVRRYLATKVITSGLVGVLVWASLALIGMELAGIFGILAFLLNFIPVIGPIIVTVLPIPIAMAQFQSPWPVILVVVIPGGIHNIIGNILEPKLMGEGLDLHPVTIMLALSFWGLLWGIMGMFLAAPIMAVIRIVLMQFDTFKPIANLLAGDFSSKDQVPPVKGQEARDALIARPPSPSSTPPEETVPDDSLPG